MSVTTSNWLLLLIGEAFGVGIQKQTATPFIAWAFLGSILASYSVAKCMKKKSDEREVDSKNKSVKQNTVHRGDKKKKRRRMADNPAAMNPNNEAPNLSDSNHLSDKVADANPIKTKKMAADEASGTPTQPNVSKQSKAPSAQEQLAKSTKSADKPKKDEFDDWDIKLPEENSAEKQLRDSLMEIVNDVNPLAKIIPKKKSAKHDLPADPATSSGKEKEKSKSTHSGRLTGHPPPQQQVAKMGGNKTAANMMKPSSEDAKEANANLSTPLSSCDKKRTNKKPD